MAHDNAGDDLGRHQLHREHALRAAIAGFLFRSRALGAANVVGIVEVYIVNKLPKTRDEIQRLIMSKLRTFTNCEEARGVIVIPIVSDDGGATWTVSCFNRGGSDGYACDRALQRIVPHYQRLYDLAQKH